MNLRQVSVLLFAIVLALAVWLPIRSQPTIRSFYIAPNGNDTNPGTIEQPWASIHHAATMLKPGETVYLRGGTYEVTQQIRPHRSGTATAWITYTSYPGEQATIDANQIKVAPPSGNPPFAHDQGAFQIEGLGYIRVRNLQLRNSHNAGFTIRDSHDIELYNNTIDTTLSSGIAVWCQVEHRNNCQRFKIIGNTIVNANSHDMVFPGFSREWETPHEALTVSDIENFEVAYNSIHHSDKEGIDIKGSSRRGQVHHNYIHDLDRQGLYVDTWGKTIEDIDFHDNVVHDCRGVGLAISVENGQLAKNIQIHHNLIYNNLGTGIFFSRWGGDGAREQIQVYNNTVHHNGYGKPNPGETFYWVTGGLFLYTSNLQKIEIKNNIFSDNQAFQIGYSDRYLTDNSAIESVLQQKQIAILHNLSFTSQTFTYPIRVGWPPNDYANVRQILGAAVITDKPKFIDPKTGNFYLQPGFSGSAADSPQEHTARFDLGAFPIAAKPNLWWQSNFPPQFELP
ncbi:right-handed parallel beta-helix repeat-containing protein [Pantanalinema sp. GBBB05]|uniref:right-handed parallel beta-helix repeat-containing protein n=1 Tax=Pantanalinema sp. GBBB05 TaxID=2604139 RepID=UPI001DFF7FAB|nr:right-handed parallel beta-helix repeat-containing protein [Pantanalinema sp. GBBB05]